MTRQVKHKTTKHRHVRRAEKPITLAITVAAAPAPVPYPPSPQIDPDIRYDYNEEEQRWYEMKRVVVKMHPWLMWLYIWNEKRRFRRSLKRSHPYGLTSGWRRRCLNVVQNWRGPLSPFPFEPMDHVRRQSWTKPPKYG